MNVRSVMMYLFSILMIAILAWYVGNHWQDIKNVKLVNPNYLWILVGLLLTRMTLRGYFHWQVMRSLQVPIPLNEALALNFSGTMMNQLLPMPVGPGYRAAYLKRNYNFPFSLFASTLAALFIYWLSVSCSLGLLAAIWFYLKKGIVDWMIMAILAVIVGACVLTFVIPKRFSNLNNDSKSWLKTRIHRIISGWNTIVSSKKLILGASLVVIVSTIVGATGMYVAFASVGVSIGLPGALLLMASQRIGSLIKLTPGAVGYQEMVGIYFATLLVPTSAEAAVVFGITRILSSLLGVVVGLPAIWMLNKRTFGTETKQEIESEVGKND